MSCNKRLQIGLFVLIMAVAAVSHAVELRDFSGKTHQLSEYTGKGKWLVVMIWASDCLICNKEAANYQAFHLAHFQKDASMLGISVDGKAQMSDARAFVDQHKLSFPNVVGELEDVAHMVVDMAGMDWVGTPTFLIFNPAGKLKVADSGAVPVELIEKYLANSRQ